MAPRLLPLASVLVLLVTSTVARAVAAGGERVDAENFERLVGGSGEAWVLEYMSPRCGTCQEMAPVFAAVAEKLKGEVRFGTVDIDTDAGMELAKRHDVFSEGIP
eukprot:CAMPEP_0183803066 /NCGR_PEP_ID=MMETSP0803_2-20130417/32039_1 /TAXON_ID=195967 /ORGANISM="Crustomastix stigmata, Strain CCMP3273" /LENGTH=104 /DNA_ID=CAMNT_0026047799 /DNA_START=1 /DNA_END=312 /DNA_ORIENTATION=+